MTTFSTQDILRKINYIEADIEIQKQILFAIPSKETQAMEDTIKIIASKKKEIEALREQIRSNDPEGFQRIEAFAAAADKFKKLAAQCTFTQVDASDGINKFNLTLKDNSCVECLVRAKEDNGNWVAITLNGDILRYSTDELAESQQ